MLKQRTFIIMTRPCVVNGEATVTVANQLGQVSVPGITGLAIMQKWTKATPMTDGVTVQAGCWVEWHRTRSYANLLREVRKLLKTISRNDILVTEIFDIDTVIVPRS